MAVIVTVRMPQAHVGRIDRAVARLKAEIPYARITRADLIRQALEVGLATFEKRAGRRKRVR